MKILNQSRMGPQNNLLSKIAMAKNILRSGDPAQIIQEEAQRNPQFAQFLKQHEGMSVDQMISESGLDVNLIKSLLG